MRPPPAAAAEAGGSGRCRYLEAQVLDSKERNVRQDEVARVVAACDRGGLVAVEVREECLQSQTEEDIAVSLYVGERQRRKEREE